MITNKTTLLILISIFSFPLYANNKIISFDNDSVNSVFCTKTNCFFPSEYISNKDIHVTNTINWNRGKNLILHTKGNIVFKQNGKIITAGDESIILKAGMLPGNKKPYNSIVKFEGSTPQIEMHGTGIVEIYYNPEKGREKHKYHNPILYGDVLPNLRLQTYMLVNNIYDLQGITACLHCSYSLSQNIDASPTRKWNYSQDRYHGFYPIMGFLNKAAFSGTFEGNNYVIDGLYIDRPDESNAGLFGDVTGVNTYKSTIKNLMLINSDVTGKRCVGAVVGQATGIRLGNIIVPEDKNRVRSILDEEQKEHDILGLLAGCILSNTHVNLSTKGSSISADEKPLFGSCYNCNEETVEDE